MTLKRAFDQCQWLFLGGCLSLWLGLVAPAIAAPTALHCPDGMALIPGGTFTMGSDNPDFVEEETAANVTVSSFCMATHEVTNADFAAFVSATGYTTVAERPLSKAQFPDLPDAQRIPGSLVFEPPAAGIEQVAYLSWWHWTPGADWQHPFGPDSTLEGKADHPVVHIAYEDAVAYADWLGRSLPTEAQWEYAARGGQAGQTYTWGEQYRADRANTWQGLFPFFNTQADRYLGTAPVMSYPPNGYGLYDMTGNVWELTTDWFTVKHTGKANKTDPTGPDRAISYDPKKPADGAVHVIKGGSYLCAKNYCSRYRPAARESQAPDTGTTHIGFRLIAPVSS
ncbi:MAG: formylglycine-generating enzyme family protein [Leptolyngbyaceae cyanobacterium]